MLAWHPSIGSSIPFLAPVHACHPPSHPAQTILDGEMVVDEDVAEDRWDRRFLAYDMVMVNGHSLVDRPWMVSGWAPARGCWSVCGATCGLLDGGSRHVLRLPAV